MQSFVAVIQAEAYETTSSSNHSNDRENSNSIENNSSSSSSNSFSRPKVLLYARLKATRKTIHFFAIGASALFLVGVARILILACLLFPCNVASKYVLKVNKEPKMYHFMHPCYSWLLSFAQSLTLCLAIFYGKPRTRVFFVHAVVRS